MTSKNEKAWRQLFGKYNILKTVNQDGYFEISANQIKEYREPRLMTKFDQRSNLPDIFLSNNLSILPITRGSYIIAKFNAYEDVNYADVETNTFSIPGYIETLDPQHIYSEANALNTVFVGQVIHHILEEEEVYQTISGRMGTGVFGFNIDTDTGSLSLSVHNSQCEIDAGFESPNKLLLLEAKNFRVDNFLIRQMYYPYRLWAEKVNKEVIPAFFTYSNDIFSFFIYRFNDKERYNSLELVSQKNYILEEEPITIEDICHILQKSTIVQEPDIPFPQANNFLRTIDLLSLLMEGELTKDEITTNYDFEPRQSNYYADAARYLGLAKKTGTRSNPIYELTPLGRQIMSKRHREKMLGIVETILQHEVFNKVLKKYIQSFSPVTIEEIVEIMKTSYIFNVNKNSTIFRRASTVKKWIEWILELIE